MLATAASPVSKTVLNCNKKKYKLPFIPLMALKGMILNVVDKNSHASKANSLEGIF